MVRWCRCFLILCALFCGGGRLFAADTAETRAFDQASRDFKNQFWDRAEIKFGAFAVRYPKSDRVPEAILYQAQAGFKLERYGAVIELLSTNLASAGRWGDQYLYWLAQSYFQHTNYAAAADTFARLTRQFPDSPYCLEACMGEATSCARRGDWPRIVELLQRPGGTFQQAVRSFGTNEFLARGFLLLGEAQLQVKDHVAGTATVERLASWKLNPELTWRRGYLQTRLRLARGQADEALQSTTSLIVLAQAANDPELLAETIVLQAEILERLQSLDEAFVAYQKNLAPGVPADQQSHALIKIAELSLKLGRIPDAIATLDRFLDQQPAVADLTLLTLGELQLSQHLILSGSSGADAVPVANSFLVQALARFETLLNRYTNSPWAGKALLDKGWCLWIAGQYPQSEAAFQLAAGRLPFSKDQAVARFKWADAQFMTNDFAGAITNYDYLVTHYASVPEVQSQLLERALYQTVGAALAIRDLPAATNAMRKILDWYPNSFAGDHCLLLVGDGFAQQNDPARARELFAEFEARFPSSPLLPEVRLAVARTHEQEGNWTAAVADYDAWLKTFTNQNARLPGAEFLRARAVAMAGQETNALALFTGFVTRYPTNELVPQVQWCIAEYYFGKGDFYSARMNYLYVSTNRPMSELTCQAQMMAGRAAMASLSYKDAIGYFTNLASKPECPVDLRIQAALAAGDAFMSRTDPEVTNRQADLEEALGWFNSVPVAYPTNRAVPLAYGLIGNCYLQMASADPLKFGDASNAYQVVLTLTNATPASRYQAKIGLATVAEKLSRQRTGDEQIRLINLALNYCLDVLNDNLYPASEETRDPPSAKEAGMRAGRLAESLNEWQQAINVYSNLQELLPAFRTTWQSRIASAQKHLEP